MTYNCKTALLLLALAALSACGGNGSGAVASAPIPLPTPSPTPTPTPTEAANDASVELLATPATQELAVATRADPLQIRYDASRAVYEVKAGNFDWSAVTDAPDPSDGPNRNFTIAGQPNTSYFRTEAHNRAADPGDRYQYSNLAYWQASGADGGDFGNVAAFGAATPASGVPVSGSASFQGLAVGEADIKDTGWGFATTRLEGTVKLDFDFAAGFLSGSLALATACDCSNSVSTGTIAFSNPVYSRGSQTFSGSFATSVAGTNAFDGRFTGPGAEELIGSWSLPFLFEGATHQAWGAWLAKRGN
jgi:hypothetical protein